MTQQDSPAFDFVDGESPLLISVPHCGYRIPAAVQSRMTSAAAESVDSDWWVDRLYHFAHAQGHAVQTARFSRYVIDLNRPDNQESLYPGQFEVGLCPLQSFDGDALYLPGHEPDDAEISSRISAIWKPYHDNLAAQLQRRVDRFGFALLWDAHSIRSSVPLLFEGRLPDLNFGTNANRSCNPALLNSVMTTAAASGDYSIVANQRFKGGYITRHYGDPSRHVHAIQLEISQAAYLNEAVLDDPDLRDLGLRKRVERAWCEEKASVLSELLSRLMPVFIDEARHGAG